MGAALHGLVADAIRKSAPKFGFKAGNVKPLRNAP
jgi:hypothetical protein